MIPARFARKYDERRLRNLLLGLLVALAIPTGAVIWQAYDQLKWESWYQYRNQAESLVRQIDFAIAEDIADAESREFNDFTFLDFATMGGTKQVNLVFIKMEYAFKPFTHTNWPGDRCALNLEHVFHFIHQLDGITTFTIEFVNKGQDGGIT